MELETTTPTDRMAGGPASRVVGLYQMLLRRNLEHFFPDATLDVLRRFLIGHVLDDLAGALIVDSDDRVRIRRIEP